MEMLLSGFDPERRAVLNPDQVIRPVEGFPETVVSTFADAAIEALVGRLGGRQIARLYTANGPSPVYQIQYDGLPVALFRCRVGAPAAVGGFEEIIAMGGRRLLLYGCCGVLDQNIADQHLIVPTHALRDEGTSYHYQPPAPEIALDPAGVESLCGTFERLGLSYVRGKTWTTDGLYRETPGKVEARRAQGCVAVEMECAAMAAAAAFRGVEFAQFLYAADNLDAEQWQPRGLGKNTLTLEEKYLAMALECAVDLAGGGADRKQA